MTLLFGRWQDVLPGLGRQFDGVMTDTFGEYYDDLRRAAASLFILHPSAMASNACLPSTAS